ncbi:hypothetical protein, partial [Alienimonas sp. DA493]|uniref:hypothetical protein n=1 Tax=Alienimonas sp. DA493 TaxID=3373605 RepID=UPI003754D11C
MSLSVLKLQSSYTLSEYIESTSRACVVLEGQDEDGCYVRRECGADDFAGDDLFREGLVCLRTGAGSMWRPW